MQEGIDSSAAPSLEQILYKLGACNCCIESWLSAAQADEKSPSAKRPRHSEASGPASEPCTLCLGLLGDPACRFAADVTPARLTAATIATEGPSMLDCSPPRIIAQFSSIREALAAIQAAWDIDAFALDFSLPAEFAYRAQAAWWKAKNAGAVNVPPVAFDVKGAVRRLFLERIAQVIGAKYDPDASFRLVLTCETDSEAAGASEAAAVGGRQPHPPKSGRGGRGRWRKNRKKQEAQPEVASVALIARLAALSEEEFAGKCPPLEKLRVGSEASPPLLMLTPSRKPVYVGGRYLKLRRGIPQTLWILDGERRGGSSVAEEIARVVVPAVGADEYTFLSSGREDADVRMLGNGRPFALSICNARSTSLLTPPTLLQMAADLAERTDAVRARGLAVLTSRDVELLKTGEEEKRKSYAAVCWLPRAVTAADLEKINAAGPELVVQQWTPLRVLQRRANACRERVLHAVAAEALPGRPEGYFLLRLTTQAGTYVKEFVHGDRGRTRPSVRELLGCEAECAHLDVMGVELDFLD